MYFFCNYLKNCFIDVYYIFKVFDYLIVINNLVARSLGMISYVLNAALQVYVKLQYLLCNQLKLMLT